MFFADTAIKYFLSLKPPNKLPGKTYIINPYEDAAVRNIVRQFYKKFFNDDRKRIYLFGINPGRFGGGLTGISFTDPVALSEHCGIDNRFGTRKELSSKFIYKIIEDFGGAKKFYSKYFITALYPLTILKENKNFNYYDTAELLSILKPYIKSSVEEQYKFGASKKFAVCIGKKNSKHLKEINEELKLFNEIRVVDHPRYIMQYKLKSIKDYILQYRKALS